MAVILSVVVVVLIATNAGRKLRCHTDRRAPIKAKQILDATGRSADRSQWRRQAMPLNFRNQLQQTQEQQL